MKAIEQVGAAIADASLPAQVKTLVMKKISCILIVVFVASAVYAQGGDWYYTHETSEPDIPKFAPSVRLVYTLKNRLDVERKNAPVVIRRTEFPMPDIHEMWITIVDPSLPSYEGPDAEVLAIYGGQHLGAEVHGHAVSYQLDDLDKDGIWDELK